LSSDEGQTRTSRQSQQRAQGPEHCPTYDPSNDDGKDLRYKDDREQSGTWDKERNSEGPKLVHYMLKLVHSEGRSSDCTYHYKDNKGNEDVCKVFQMPKLDLA
jgi:hypothetical protein